MEARSLNYIYAATQCELRGGSPKTRVSRICTDSRQAKPGDLFIALAGERFDGHNFIDDVAAKGVAAVMVDRSKAPANGSNCAVLLADDTRQALGRLAARYRQDFDPHVVAVGGSNGKTTTKELIAAVLKQKFCTLWSEASFNNEIGVPLSLLKIERRHQAAVLEVGTNHPGELAPLLRLIQPRFGVLTSIGREHLEFFGDLAGVAQEEGSLAESLPLQGALVINGDSPCADEIARRTLASVVRVGFGPQNEWRVNRLCPDEAGVTFEVASPRPEFNGEYRVNLLGRHQAANALLAVVVGAQLGLAPEQVREGLASCQPPKMRLQIWEAHGVRVLDDSYNANADSMLAALQTLHDLPCNGRRIAVLGDMAELGQQSAAAHLEVGRRAAELDVSCLLAVGNSACQTAEAARAAGLCEVSQFADAATAAIALKKMLQAGDLVLLKASRAAGLERVGQALRAE
jgi:UDP-N-acetylmuramoyl-tripeptide--D-alanyl-D-alanine ligase